MVSSLTGRARRSARRAVGRIYSLSATLGLMVCLVMCVPDQVAQAQEPPVRDTTATDTLTTILDPIQVVVTRRVTPLDNVAFAVSRLSGDVIRRGRATVGLDESFVKMSGVYVANRYNPSLDEQVSIRGFGSRSAFGVRGVKIMLDGIPQTLPDGQGQLTNVELSSIGAVEVLKGSVSSLYGNASGGVIDFRSIQPDPSSPTIGGRFVGGSYGLFKWGIDGSVPVGQGTIAAGFAQTVMNGYREHSEADKRQLRLRFEQDFGERTTLLLTGYYADDPLLQNPGSLNETEVMEDPQQANPRNVAADARKAVEQGQLGMSLAHSFDNGGEVQFTAFGLGRTLDNPLSFAVISFDRRALGFRATGMTPLGSGALSPWIVAGIDLQGQRDDRLNTSVDSTTITLDQRERVTEVGPFLQFAMSIGPRFTFNLGGRYDWVSFEAQDKLISDGDASGERTMSSPSGTIGVVYRVSEAAQPYANVSTSFQTPTTTELVNRPTGPGGLNPELDPEKSVTVELGVRGQFNTLTYSAAIFNANITDALIPFEVPTDPGRRFFRNAGSTRNRGVEVEFTWAPVRELSLSAAYTFANYTFVDFTTEDATFDGNTLPGVPKHHLFASARYDAPVGLWLAADNTFTSEVYVDDANTTAAPEWYVLNIRAGWEGNLGAWRIAPFAAVLNLFAKDYVGSVLANAGFGRYYDPAPPRNGYLGIEIGPRR